MKVFQNKK